MIWTRNIVIMLLITCTLSSSLLVPLIYLDFEVRRDYIEKVLCIDRKKPIAVCKGSCVLSSRIDFAREHEQNEEKSGPIEIVFFFSQNQVEEKEVGYSMLTKQRVFDDQINYESHLRSIFHPPSV